MDLDCAADGITAEQSPLWSAQNLDTIDVNEVKHVAGRTAEVDAVDIHRDAWISDRCVVCLADAANKDLANGARARRRRGLVELQVRYGITQLIHGMKLSRFQLFAAQRRNGDRYLLDAFFAAAGRDDDILDQLGAGVCAVGIVRLDRAKHELRDRDRGRCATNC